MLYKKPKIYNTPTIYKTSGGVYNTPGVYGAGGGVVIGGRNYPIITVAGYTFIAFNLDYKFDGCNIGGGGVPTTPNAWYYNNDEDLYGLDGERKCGLLYNWHAVKYLNDNKETLIPGWHVPSRDEWQTIFNEIGGLSVAGKKLKANNLNWAPGWNGSNDYGISIVPAGDRSASGNFGNLTLYGNLWTSSQWTTTNSYNVQFDQGDASGISYNKKERAFPIRLIKDV